MIGVPKKAITNGPYLNRRHVDGPLLSWAGRMHWLTWRERLALFFRFETVDEVACKRWPDLARKRFDILFGRYLP